MAQLQVPPLCRCRRRVDLSSELWCLSQAPALYEPKKRARASLASRLERKRLFTVLGKERVEQHEPGEARGTEESFLPPEKMTFFASARGKKGRQGENGFPFYYVPGISHPVRRHHRRKRIHAFS